MINRWPHHGVNCGPPATSRPRRDDTQNPATGCCRVASPNYITGCLSSDLTKVIGLHGQ